MLKTVSKPEPGLLDDKLPESYSLAKKLEQFNQMLASCLNESHTLSLKQELSWISENLSKEVGRAIKNRHNDASCLKALDKANAYCCLADEILFAIWDEISENTFDLLSFILFQIREEFKILIDLRCARIAYKSCCGQK